MARPFVILVCLAWFAVPAQAQIWTSPDGKLSTYHPENFRYVKIDAVPPGIASWESKDGRIKLSVGEEQVPASKELSLEEVAAELAKEVNGTVLEKKTGRVGRQESINLTVKYKDNGKVNYVKITKIAFEGKLYTLRATTTDIDPRGNAEIAAFFAHLYVKSVPPVVPQPTTGKKNVFPGSEPPKSVSYRMGQIAGGCLLLALVLAIVFKVTGLGKKKKKNKKARGDDEDGADEDDDSPRRRKRRADDDE